MRDQEIVGLYEAYYSIYEDLDNTNQEFECLDEADSLEAMRARREKRLAAQRKREGRPTGGGDFGHDYSKPSSGRTGYLDAIDKKKKKNKDKNEEVEFDTFDVVLEYLVSEGFAETNENALAIMANMSDEWKQSIVEEVLDEAEGSYGQTPTARKAYGDLANKRRATPASGFAKRGEKTTKVKSAERHFNRTGNPDAGNRGKKSTKPSFHSGARKGMTQSDRDYARGEAEYGHTGYDPDFDGGPSAPGGKPKGKKAERQKKTGVSAD